MAKPQIPQTLIDQIQILLRKEALFESFNPNDPSIPPPPTLEAAVAGTGQFRCPHCKGELLRGLESIICVYCGRSNQPESPREEISFKSTLGFRWLLQSLRLDGSESVGPSTLGTQSNRAQRSLKDEIVLSDFLNMELQWPNESNRFGFINEERSSTLVGVDLNELVSEVSNDNTSTTYSEQLVTTKNTEIEETTIFLGQRNLNLFEETNFSLPASRSNEGEHAEAFSGWEAEFQSAIPDAKGPFSDNISHVDSVQGDDLKKIASTSASFAFPSLSKQPEGNILVDGVPSGFSFPLDDQQETTTGHTSHTEGIVGDDSYRITSVNNNHSEPSTTTTLVGVENSEPDVSDGWNDFIGSVAVSDPKPGENDLGLLNVAQQDRQGIHADILQSKAFSQDDSIGLWSTTVSTTVPEDQMPRSGAKSPAIGTTKVAEESFDLWNDFNSSPLEIQVGNNMKGDDTTIDVWNDFVSPSPSHNNDDQISKEKDNYDKSIALPKDSKLNAWNDLTLPVGVSVGKSIDEDITFGEWNDFSSSTVTHSDQHQSSHKKEAESQTVLESDDLFSYPSTKFSQDQTGAFGGLESMKDNSPFDAWGDFGQTIQMPDKQSEAGGIQLYEDIPTTNVNDFFSGWSETGPQSTNQHNDKLNSNVVMAHDGKSISKNDDSFDLWGEFTVSSNVPVKQLPSSNAPVSGEAVKHDVFDSWNVFTSPSSVQADNNIMLPKENMQGISLFGTNADAQGVECMSSSKQDLLLGVSSARNCSQDASSPPKFPDLVWTENGGGKAEGDLEKINPNETTCSVNSEVKSSDVETLISEMHDLSFMLENSLTIPKNGE